MINIYFKQTNLDFDRSKPYYLPDTIIIDAFFIPEDEVCPICSSTNLSKNGHIKKNIKHCTYYMKLIIL